MHTPDFWNKRGIGKLPGHLGMVVVRTAPGELGAHLPEGDRRFTTVGLKSNFLGTTLDGQVECVARATHLGKTMQVWDATLTHAQSGRTQALFRCTQRVLVPRAGSQ
jgi:acyl-coenzyme A thioesterase PaaI-like protein